MQLLEQNIYNCLDKSGMKREKGTKCFKKLKQSR